MYILREIVYNIMYIVIQHNLVHLNRMHDLQALMNAVLQAFFHLDFCYSGVHLRTIWDVILQPHVISHNF